MKYRGRVISSTAPVANSSQASGIWFPAQHMQGIRAETWPIPTGPFTFTNTLLNSYNFTGSVFSFTAPGNAILVDVYGAQGGTGSNDSGPVWTGALGGRVQAYFQVTPGSTIYGLVGGQGGTGNSRAGGGGGGFSALWTGSSDPGVGTWLIGAGGGGGGSGAGDNGVTLQSATGGGTSTVTQSTSRSGGAGGAGGNGGTAGGSGSTSGGGAGGSGPGDMSGGGGGGGNGQLGGSSGINQYIGGAGGFGGGGGGASGGSGGWPYRVSGGGGGGGGWNGGNGGLHGAYNGLGGTNFYFSQTLPVTQLVTSSQGVRSGNGFMEIRY